MYKRSRKTKGVSRRLAALLLCCACLFGAVSVSAIALEAEASPVTDASARAAILEDNGTKSDNTEPAPTTAPTAPTETTAPAETTAPTETTAPAETTAPTETTAPAETTAPTETTAPDAPSEPETTAPADPDDGAAPVSENEPEPTGAAAPENTPAENEEVPEDVENEEAGEPVGETLSVYDRLMAAATCEEAAAVFEDEENEEALFALTLQQLSDIREHIDTLEEDELGLKAFVLNALDALIAKASGGEPGGAVAPQSTFNIVILTNNAKVAYVDTSTGSTALVPVTNGSVVNASATSGVLVFFLKPEDGYLLTEYRHTNGGACDLYSVNVSAADSKIRWFNDNPDKASSMLEAAKSGGYVGYFAFTFDTSGTVWPDASFTISAQKPAMSVEASASPNNNLKPGDKVTFTVTVVPGGVAGIQTDVTETKIVSLKINDVEYTATKNPDGTFSVEYTITEEDWQKQKAVLNVDAEMTYAYGITVKDRDNTISTITTNATVTGSASCDVRFATKKGVVYQVKFDPDDKADKTEFPAAPVDNDNYFEGDSVSVNTTYNSEPVDDPVNGGTWTFDGWYHGTEKVGQTLTMGTDNILLVGTWTFTPYPTHVLTIRKTVSGNMQDVNKAFAFTVTADKDMTYGEQSGRSFNFNLKKDESVTITVPVGAVVTVTEDRGGYVRTIGYGTTVTDCTEVTDGVQFTMPGAESLLIFNNDKNITVDTGILLDSLPYVLILVLVGVGAVLFVKKRHNRDDD